MWNIEVMEKKTGFKSRIDKQADGRPVHQLIAKCVECGAEDGINNRSSEMLPEALISKKFQQKGWVVAKRGKKLICPKCQKAIKAEKEQKKMEIDKATKRRIIVWLNELFDPDTGRYSDGYTDQRLGNEKNVPWAHIKTIREEFFGPIKGDPEIDAIKSGLEKLEEALAKENKNLELLLDQAMKRMETMEATIGNLKQRVMTCEKRLGC